MAPLSGRVSTVTFSPDPAATYFVVGYEDDRGQEVRRGSDGRLIVGLEGEVRSINFSPDPAATYFLVHYGDGHWEVRRSDDGNVTAELSAQVYSLEFSPDPSATYLVVNYGGVRREVRRSADGRITAKLDGPDGREDTWVRFSPYATCFVSSYADGTAEVRSSADGKVTAKLTSLVYRDHLFFPPGASGSCFVVRYPDAPGELRSSDDGRILEPLPGRVTFVNFGPGPAPTDFVVSYGDAPGELRHCADGRLIAKLAGKSSSAWFDSSSTRFVVKYEDVPGELRDCADGRIIATLAAEVAGHSEGVRFSPGPSSTYFAVQYANNVGLTDGLEVRHRDGTVIAELRKVGSREPGFSPQDVEFSPDPSATYFVVHYHGDGMEVRRSADGQVTAKLDSRVAVIGKRFKGFSPSPSAGFFVVGGLGEPGELRKCADGEVVAILPASINSVNLFRESEQVDFMICGSNTSCEVWGLRPSVHRLTALGLGVGQIETLQGQRAVAVYNDGRAYLLDLAWLRAMGGNPATLSPDELLQTARTGPFARGLFDESTLVFYLDGRPPLAFR